MSEKEFEEQQEEEEGTFQETIANVPVRRSLQLEKAVGEQILEQLSKLMQKQDELEKDMAVYNRRISQATRSTILLGNTEEEMSQNPGPNRINQNPSININRQEPTQRRLDQAFFPQMSYHTMSIKDVINHIPIYNGSNMSFFQFARACRSTLKMIPLEWEIDLARMIRSRLKGHAYLLLEDEDFYSVEDILKKLKAIFSPVRPHHSYRGELQSNFMKPTEHLFDYIARVKDLRTAIIEEEEINLDPNARIYIREIDNITLISFMEGLPSEYRLHLKLDNCNTLKDAFESSINIHKSLERDRIRGYNVPQFPANNIRNNFVHNSQDQNNSPRRGGYNGSGSENRNRDFDKDNHDLNNSPRRGGYNGSGSESQNIDQGNYPRPDRFANQQINIRRNEGAEQRPRKNYQQRNYPPGDRYTGLDSNPPIDHRTRNTGNPRPPVICYYCNEPGHYSNECQQKLRDQRQRTQGNVEVSSATRDATEVRPIVTHPQKTTQQDAVPSTSRG